MTLISFQPLTTLLPVFRPGRPRAWLLLLLPLLLPVAGPELSAQKDVSYDEDIGQSRNEAAPRKTGSAVFPAKRHQELMEELDFTPPDKDEEEEEPEKEEFEEPFDWGDFGWSDLDFGFGSGVTIVILLILLGLLGFLIFRMLGDVSLRKRARTGDEEDRIDINDIEEEKLVASGISLSLLERAERAGQFDVAVRLMYIQLLKELQDAGLIKYRKDFSNRDYQNQLTGRTVLPDFRSVTAEYERYWFGKYPIDRLSYRNTYQRFQALNESVRAGSAKTSANV